MQAKFIGRPLIEVPRDVPQIGFLQGDFGREFLAEYNGRIEFNYKNNEHLRVLSESGGLVKGSNPFAVVLANEVLREEGLRTAAQADLEQALRLEALNLRGTYTDTALVLRSKDNPNSYLANDLAAQLKARNPQVKYPVLINLSDLLLRVDPDSDYGLAFTLKEGVNPIYALVLNSPSGSRFSSEDIGKIGLPKQTGKGDRFLYTRDSGLSRLCLCWDLNLYSYFDVLAFSDSGGRVVVVGGAAAQKTSE